MVKLLDLETLRHPRTYPLGWICKNSNIQVTRKCILRFTINSNFLDEVELDGGAIGPKMNEFIDDCVKLGNIRFFPFSLFGVSGKEEMFIREILGSKMVVLMNIIK